MFNFLSQFHEECGRKCAEFSEWRLAVESQLSALCLDDNAEGTEGVAECRLGGVVDASICSILLGVQKVMKRNELSVAASEKG